MKLQTTVSVSPESNKIDYTSKLLLLGSCFAESMGERLEYFKFQNLQNPFGVIFNPLSISSLLERAATGNRFTAADVFERDGQWFCFEAHSLLTATSSDDLLDLLNRRLELLKAYMETATHIVFTYGTAWVYRYTAEDKVVANCQKLPQKEFKKELLSVSEIENAMNRALDSVKKINKDVSAIGTISPVRHLKDGFVENTRSKARLIEAIHKVPNFRYFPSFEIMMDELRDYRFYEKDLLHPNETAIGIIWERFKSVWVSSETDALQKEIDSIQKGLQHRPFVPDSDSHRAFQNQLQKKIKAISEKLPHVDFHIGE
jgi:lysophospholipase L1-like esterase